jgi:hypothetical protein
MYCSDLQKTLDAHFMRPSEDIGMRGQMFESRVLPGLVEEVQSLASIIGMDLDCTYCVVNH